MAEDDVIVSIEADPVQAADVVVPDPAKPEPKAPDPKDELKAQFERAEREAAEERTKRIAAQQEADRTRQERDVARTEVETTRGALNESQLGTVESGIAAAKAEADAAEREFHQAFESGDAAKTAAAQRKIARAEAKLVRLDEAKEDIEARTKATPEPAVRKVEPEAPRTQNADPLEAYLAGRTEPTQRWLRDHKEWVTDPRKNAKLTSAHYSAVGDGLEPDTAAYFEHVETAIGLKTNGTGNGAAKPNGSASVRRSAPPPAAPVGASAGGTNGGGNEVRLSRSEAAAATDGTHVWNYSDPSGQNRFKKGEPIGVQEFARRKLEMTRQGLYDKSLTEQ